MMALFAPFTLLPGQKFQVKQFRQLSCRLSGSLLYHSNHRTSHPSCTKISMTQFGEPDRVKEQLSSAKERLWDTIPEAVKTFPWEKAVAKTWERFLIFGQKALKWSLITLFTLSSLSDAIYSISRNQELIIPFGLFVGCLLADFLQEISEEAFHGMKEEGSNWQLWAVGCTFLFLKFISIYFTLRARVFLLHVGNGGLMQIFWQWRNLVKANGSDGDETSSAAGTSN